jgi:hypothetical protein
MTEPTPDPQAAYSRIVNAADKLFTAVADLEAAGGMARLAAGWTPKARDRAAVVLKSSRDALDGQLATLKALNRGPVKRRPPGST